MSLVIRVLICLTVAGATLAGCGGTTSDQMVRTGPVPVRLDADGTLASNPSPLTLTDVAKQPAGSAQRAVIQLIFWAQWGNLPAVVDAYDPRVVASLGASRIIGAYDLMRDDLLNSQPRIAGSQRRASEAFVWIAMASKDATQAEGFVMRRRAGGWRVVYDTMLERAIPAATADELDPGKATPSTAALREGERVARRYRDGIARMLPRPPLGG